MRLYLMRHGKAAIPQVDPQQGLTAEGRAEIERVAKELAQRKMHITVALHSEKARARQTAEIMTGFIAPEVTPQLHEHLKPNDDPQIVNAEIAKWQHDTLLTSHLPFIPALLELLTGNAGASSAISFEPGTVVSLLKDHEGNWHIEWITSP